MQSRWGVLLLAASSLLLHGCSSEAEEKSALLLVDVQDCFLDMDTTTGEAGSLPVTGASLIIPKINQIRAEKACLFDTTFRSQDFHPEDHVSFGPTHGLPPFYNFVPDGTDGIEVTCIKPESGKTSDAACCPKLTCPTPECAGDACNATDGSPACPSEGPATEEANTACTVCSEDPDSCFDTWQAMWTVHCLQNGDSTFPPSLTTDEADIIVQKGTNKYVDAYSAFMDNTKTLKTELDDKLKEAGITHLYIAGIATDVCVWFTASDAIDLGYKVTLIEDASAGIAPAAVTAAVEDMAAKGATIVQTADVLAMECPA